MGKLETRTNFAWAIWTRLGKIASSEIKLCPKWLHLFNDLTFLTKKKWANWTKSAILS